MVQSVLLNHLVTLRALTRARSAENHNILHIVILLLFYLFTLLLFTFLPFYSSTIV